MGRGGPLMAGRGRGGQSGRWWGGDTDGTLGTEDPHNPEGTDTRVLPTTNTNLTGLWIQINYF